MWSCTAGQVGPVWGTGCGILATDRGLGCFWCAACVSASNGCPHSAQMLLQIWPTSVSHRQAPKQGWSIHLAWAGLYGRVVMGNHPATHTVSNTPSLSCFGSKKASGMLFTSRIHSPLVSPTCPPTSQGGSSSLCLTPGLGQLIYSSHCSLPKEYLCLCNIPLHLSPLPEALVLTWLLLFPSYSVLCGSFLQPW